MTTLKTLLAADPLDLSTVASHLDGLERGAAAREHGVAALREVVGNLPVVAYNLPYDWDDVLVPEWKRLGIAPVGSRGFCALRLAQRLLDPVPSGNCKLQTLRRYYALPERAAHSAEGDVLTVVDLFQHVLRPIAEERGLEDWDALAAFAEEEWYPSRIAFGKHKGRSIFEAKIDSELRGWIEWLCDSKSERSRRKSAKVGAAAKRSRRRIRKNSSQHSPIGTK